MKPGKYSNIPIDEYHADDSISNSGLSVLANGTPAHFKKHIDGKLGKKTKSLAFGKDAHCMILEPDVFAETYAIGPDVRKNTNIWKDFAAKNPNMNLIKKSEHKELLNLKGEMFSSGGNVRWLLEKPGETEVSYFWKDKETGLNCRCRGDKVIDLGNIIFIVDIKTTKDASPIGFKKAISTYGYHRQDAFYSSGIEEIEKKPVKFVFLAIESSSLIPAAYECDDRDKEDGANEVRSLLNTIMICKDSGVWPGYSDKIEKISRTWRY